MSESERQTLEIFTTTKRLETDKEYLLRLIQIILDSGVFANGSGVCKCKNLGVYEGWCSDACQFMVNKKCAINTIGDLAKIIKSKC